MHPYFRVIAPACSAAAMLLASACFDFDATEAGGPLGAEDDSGFPNPGPDGSAGPDATLPDGAPVPASDAATDGGADTASPADARGPDTGPSTGPYCATVPHDGGIFFCDDFDEHPLPGGWNSWEELQGTLVESDASAASPPNAAVETTFSLSNGQPIDVALRTTLGVPSLPSTLRFSFSVEPVQVDTNAAAAIVLSALDFLDGTGDRYTIGLAVNVSSGEPALALGEQTGLIDGGNLPDGAPPAFLNHPLPPSDPLVVGAWTSVLIEVDWSSSSVEGKVYLNGNEELDVPLSLSVVPTSLQIGIGTSYVNDPNGSSPAWQIRYDNVLFTAN